MKLKNKIIQLSCDGGAATGKSTGAKMISKKYKLKFLSSGLLYRYASFLLIKYKPKNKINFLRKKFKKLNYKKLNKINLHTLEISKQSAVIAKIYKVRKILKNFQINFSKKHKNCCIEGRDISTKILPNSDVKFFFKCNLKVASKRRFKEFRKIDKEITLKEVESAIKHRNYADVTRAFMPLRIPPGAVIVSTSSISKKEMFERISEIVEKKLLLKYGRNYKAR